MLHERSIQGVVFDLDGVLIDSAPCHRQAFEEVLQPFGVMDFDYTHYAGWRTGEVIRAELARTSHTVDGPTLAAAAARKTQLAREKILAGNPVMKDCLPVLRELAARYVLALATSGSRGTVEVFLTANRCRHLFQSILTGEDVVQAKPDPEIYSKTFVALGLHPSVCVVVEDATAGIQAATSAGAIGIGLTGTCSKQMLRDAGAAYTIDALRELPDLLTTR